MADLDITEIYENSVMYGEDLDKEGFRKYLNEKMDFVDSLFAQNIEIRMEENIEIIDSVSNVHSFIKSKKITRDEQKQLIKNTVFIRATDGYLDGLKNMGYIEIEDEK